MKTQILAFLKGVPVVVYVVAGAITVAGGWLALNNAHQRKLGALNAQIAQHEQANADLRHQADSLAKVYRTDTLWRRVTQTRVDSLTVTVDQWKHDTLRVVEFVARADTAAKACTQALGTCEERVRIAQLGWANARDEINRIKALPKQGWIARHTAASVGVGATVGHDGKIAVGPTISFGLRFFP